MFKMDLTTDLDKFVDRVFQNIKKDIRTNVIENGMDKELKRSLKALKSQLLQYINTEVKETPVENKGETLDQINVPKSDSDLIKHMFGVNIADINKSKHHTTSLDSNVFFIEKNRVRLRVPEDAYGNMEKSYKTALDRFKNSVFIDTTPIQPKYYFNNSFDSTPFVKIVCSTDTGITDDSQKTYESYKNSNKRTRHLESPLGRFSEWTLLQEGVKQLKKESVDITSILENVKNAEYERATEEFRRLNVNKSIPQIEEKIEDLKNNVNLPPDVETHKNLVTLIKNLTISKNIQKELVTYSLVSRYNEEGATFFKFYDEIKSKVSTWIVINDSKWFNHILKVIKKTIKKTLKGLK